MRDSVIADIRVLPFGTETASLSHYVAGCVRVLEQATGISYQIAPMATTVEGPLERVLEVLQLMHEIPFTMGVDRVVTSINIDDRRDKQITMESKVKAVAEKLQASPAADLTGVVR